MTESHGKIVGNRNNEVEMLNLKNGGHPRDSDEYSSEVGGPFQLIEQSGYFVLQYLVPNGRSLLRVSSTAENLC